MEAGRELDALVAEKVMGWEPGPGGIHLFPPKDEPNRKRFTRWNGEARVTEIPHYSTDIAAAWEVVEKLGHKFQMFLNTRGKWTEADFVHWPDNLKGYVAASADTAPLAICLAALKACGVDLKP